MEQVAILQERSELIEAQLAETTSQLHELKLRQKQLEARNQLLEKVAVMNKQNIEFSGDLQHEHWVRSANVNRSWPSTAAQ